MTCFDCHVNGHTNGGDAPGRRHPPAGVPPPHRHADAARRQHPAAVRLAAGAARAIEDFTEFEQRAAYFDGDPITATKKGVNLLERGSQVHFMAEFQALLDFPPAPKLERARQARPEARRAKRSCAARSCSSARPSARVCHPAPYYTDNTMHNLKTERFYKPQTINGHMAVGDGPIKTFPLRGIKDSPPYLHDGRLLTLEDTVEFFNLVLETKLTERGEGRPGGVHEGAVTRHLPWQRQHKRRSAVRRAIAVPARRPAPPPAAG